MKLSQQVQNNTLAEWAQKLPLPKQNKLLDLLAQYNELLEKEALMNEQYEHENQQLTRAKQALHEKEQQYLAHHDRYDERMSYVKHRLPEIDGLLAEDKKQDSSPDTANHEIVTRQSQAKHRNIQSLYKQKAILTEELAWLRKELLHLGREYNALESAAEEIHASIHRLQSVLSSHHARKRELTLQIETLKADNNNMLEQQRYVNIIPISKAHKRYVENMAQHPHTIAATSEKKTG
jgi:chromosome segregation ATPase